MSDDNPFKSEATVIRPSPGGRPTPGGRRDPVRAPDDVAPAPIAESAAVEHPVVSGLGPMTTAAGPLLALVGWLRLLPAHNDIAKLRQRLLAELQSFDAAARHAGQTEQAVRQADYILCATLDDVIANTPWGSAGEWSRQSLSRTRHNDATGGDQFFRLAEQYREDAGNQLAGLELIYYCLSLGFEGRMRISRQGSADLLRLRENIHRLLRQHRGERQQELSPHWRGAEGGRALASAVPLWAIVAGAAAVITMVFVGLTVWLNDKSDTAYADIVALPPTRTVATPAQIAALPPTTAVARISGFLEPEIRQNLVSVFDDGHNTVVRIVGNGMFGSASAAVEPQTIPTLNRIADALSSTHGPILVTGHTDNHPIHSQRFPSNFDLSTARAVAVRDILAAHTPAIGSRIVAEGRADSEPIDSNATPEGQHHNRRIDLILSRDSETDQ